MFNKYLPRDISNDNKDTIHLCCHIVIILDLNKYLFKIGKLVNGNLFILAIFAPVKNKSVWYIKFPWLAPKQLQVTVIVLQ